VEAEASGLLGSWLGQLGVFGAILAVLMFFFFMWLRESRAVRQDTEGAIARKAADLTRKNGEIAELHEEVRDLKQQLRQSEERERATYAQLMECRFPELKQHGPEMEQ
jgi:uncharacterized protein YlxW (UPF0749 family)